MSPVESDELPGEGKAKDRLPGRPEATSGYCPVCSLRLKSQNCKLVCLACGYYMSCSDFY
jgi:hypothetical protein